LQNDQDVPGAAAAARESGITLNKINAFLRRSTLGANNNGWRRFIDHVRQNMNRNFPPPQIEVDLGWNIRTLYVHPTMMTVNDQLLDDSTISYRQFLSNFGNVLHPQTHLGYARQNVAIRAKFFEIRWLLASSFLSKTWRACVRHEAKQSHAKDEFIRFLFDAGDAHNASSSKRILLVGNCTRLHGHRKQKRGGGMPFKSILEMAVSRGFQAYYVDEAWTSQKTPCCGCKKQKIKGPERQHRWPRQGTYQPEVRGVARCACCRRWLSRDYESTKCMVDIYNAMLDGTRPPYLCPRYLDDPESTKCDPPFPPNNHVCARDDRVAWNNWRENGNGPTQNTSASVCRKLMQRYPPDHNYIMPYNKPRHNRSVNETVDAKIVRKRQRQHPVDQDQEGDDVVDQDQANDDDNQQEINGGQVQNQTDDDHDDQGDDVVDQNQANDDDNQQDINGGGQVQNQTDDDQNQTDEANNGGGADGQGRSDDGDTVVDDQNAAGSSSSHRISQRRAKRSRGSAASSGSSAASSSSSAKKKQKR
jgi:hypothetical protein